MKTPATDIALPSVLRLFALVTLSLAVARADAQSGRPGPMQTVEFATGDGVQLKGSFYPSNLGKKAPVAVLLADQGQSRASLARLAEWLQRPDEEAERPSFAVLAIDLRGQGDSTLQRLPSGATRSLSGAKIGPAELDAMIRVDMESVRDHLVTRNDQGELNLNRLAFVGVGGGAMVAACAAAVDWSAPQLAVGKQGKDVKALVLVSPPWKHKGAAMLTALRQPGVQTQVATMVMYGGEDRTATADAQRIVNQLLRARPKQLPPTKTKLPSVFDVPAPTKLQGDAWLKQMGENGEDLIGQFLEQYVAKPDYPWVQRRVK